jgi:ribosome-associated toxin RatA of RatAB toxin-antitoxin module
MKWLLRIVVSVAALAGVVAAVGWMLPVDHQASRSAEFQRPPADVYALVADVRAYPQWWPEISRVEVMAESEGRLTFREHMSTGPVVMTVRDATPPSTFVTVIDDPDQPFGGSWTFEIAPTASGGSRLTITERGEIYNPIFRALARFVFGYTSTMESFLAAAANKLR